MAREKDVPVLAFCEDVAASGGYWLACAADEIFVQPTSIVGSIGVITSGFGFAELMEKAGIERRVYTAGERKAILDPFRPENPDDVARIRALRSEEHTSELQSLMRISYAVFCLKKKTTNNNNQTL